MEISKAPQNHGNILSKNNIQSPIEGRCGYFVKRKQRYCRMLPSKSSKYCAEHMAASDEPDDMKKGQKKRIACPLDPKHTIFEHLLSKHLKKCNATKKTQLEYYDCNVNIGLKDFSHNNDDNQPLNKVDVTSLKDLINRLENLCKNIECKISDSFAVHQSLQNEINSHNEYGDCVKKHLVQQGSLINILEDNNALQRNYTFIEFGAGRGGLSHWVQKSMDDSKDCQFFLIDRQHNRNKFDCYHKGSEQGPNFERLNIDIQHLNLEKVGKLHNEEKNIVAIGKHLCGGATDLSLTCLLKHNETNSNELEVDSPPKKKSRQNDTKSRDITGRVKLCLIALCCYHHCTWETYVGRNFFQRHGLTPLDFLRITKMAAWSTCGFQRRKERNDDLESKLVEHQHASEQVETNLTEHQHASGSGETDKQLHISLGLTTEQQVEIGRKCKRLIDYGRLDFLEASRFTGQLIRYVDIDVTPENIALLVTK